MNKSKLSISSLARVAFNAFVVLALVTLASLIGVGGAALWIYGRPTPVVAKTESQRASADLAVEARVMPRLTPVQADNDAPAQLTPARYVPSESEIATISDAPRYTYVSYNGGRQQAHLRIHTVLATSVPAPLAPVAASYDDPATSAPADGRNPLSDPASHYITNAQGRVIGIDGTASAAPVGPIVARALTVQPAGLEPEVRVAAPVIVRKAAPVDDETMSVAGGGFSVQSELAREDDRPVMKAQPVNRSTRSSRPTMFGASDDFRTFGSN